VIKAFLQSSEGWFSVLQVSCGVEREEIRSRGVAAGSKWRHLNNGGP
jgi:hypothetical protein